MSTLVAVVILIVVGFSGQFGWLTVLNLAGMPGALIAAEWREKAAGPVRIILGTILSLLGQSYVYLGYVAGIVLLTKYLIPEHNVSPFFVWPAAFFASVFPIFCCAAAAGVESGSTAQITAVLTGQFVAVVGFFVFVFFPNMIWAGWPWFAPLLRWLSSSTS